MTISMQTADLAVVIGRFQPFHHGHAGLLQQALASANEVLVVLGSSFHARSAKNPFTWREREAIIRACLPDFDQERVRFAPVRDYYEDGRWADAVRQAVIENAKPAARVKLVGHFKDDSSYYLNHFPQWELLAIERQHPIDATSIRRALFEAENLETALDALAEELPWPVRHY